MSKQNHFKTKFSQAFNPFMILLLFQRVLSVAVCMPSTKKH